MSTLQEARTNVNKSMQLITGLEKSTMECTSREYAEMHFINGFCDGNARAAQRRENQDRYPKRVPSVQVFIRLYQLLVERSTAHR